MSYTPHKFVHLHLLSIPHIYPTDLIAADLPVVGEALLAPALRPPRPRNDAELPVAHSTRAVEAIHAKVCAVSHQMRICAGGEIGDPHAHTIHTPNIRDSKAHYSTRWILTILLHVVEACRTMAHAHKITACDICAQVRYTCGITCTYIAMHICTFITCTYVHNLHITCTVAVDERWEPIRPADVPMPFREALHVRYLAGCRAQHTHARNENTCAGEEYSSYTKLH